MAGILLQRNLKKNDVVLGFTGTEHAFIECSDAVFFWDELRRTLKKDLLITSVGIRY